MVKNKITLNVLADITKNIGSLTKSNSSNSNKSYEGGAVNGNNHDKALVVFTGSDINIDEKINYILELKRSGVSLSLVFSIMGEYIIDAQRIVETLNPEEVYLEEDILEIKDIANRYDYIISPNITINTMSKLSQGLIDSLIPNLIWTFLYIGKDVYVDFESTLNYMDMECQNRNLKKIILERIDNVKTMGVIEIGPKNYMNSIYRDRKFLDGINRTVGKHDIKTPDIRTSDKNSSVNNNKFITENDIRNSELEGNTLVLQEGNKLTPLARDIVRSRGISVKFE